MLLRIPCEEKWSASEFPSRGHRATLDISMPEPGNPRKPSRSKQFAQIERLLLFGSDIRMGPAGLRVYVMHTSERRKHCPYRDHRTTSAILPRCHFIELSLRPAYLSLRGDQALNCQKMSMATSLTQY